MITRPYLVTGGCGFVGRHLVKKLISHHKDIWIIDNLFTGKHPDLWLVDLGFKKKSTNNKIVIYKGQGINICFIEGDVVDVLTSEIDKQKKILPEFSDVFHLASVVGGRELIDGDPILVAKDLAIDSVFFLWLTRKEKTAERVLYASSSAIYPTDLQNTNKYQALTEKMVKISGSIGQPDMTYGWSKLTGEYLSRLSHERYGLHVACIRPFSGYGTDQDLSYPIPAIAKRVVRRENPLTIWGTGQQGRDFVYIDDCIDAFFIILDNIGDGSGCNIGSGRITSFLEVLRIFTELEDYNPKILPLVKKPVGVAHRYADIALVSKFGWKPSTTLETGLTKVLITAKNNLIQEMLIKK